MTMNGVECEETEKNFLKEASMSARYKASPSTESETSIFEAGASCGDASAAEGAGVDIGSGDGGSGSGENSEVTTGGSKAMVCSGSGTVSGASTASAGGSIGVGVASGSVRG